MRQPLSDIEKTYELVWKTGRAFEQEVKRIFIDLFQQGRPVVTFNNIVNSYLGLDVDSETVPNEYARVYADIFEALIGRRRHIKRLIENENGILLVSFGYNGQPALLCGGTKPIGFVLKTSETGLRAAGIAAGMALGQVKTKARRLLASGHIDENLFKAIVGGVEESKGRLPSGDTFDAFDGDHLPQAE